MKLLSKQASKVLSGVALTFALMNSAYATTFDIAADGTLMGAFGVNVNGTLYDVTFSDGVVANNITAFTTAIDAESAANALKAQVFLGDYAIFNASKLINGCGSSAFSACNVYTPYANVAIPNVANPTVTNSTTKMYLNWIDLYGDSVISTQASNGSLFGTSNSAIRTIARWTVSPPPSATAVPEPEVYAMMLAGLGLVGFAARRQQKAA